MSIYSGLSNTTLQAWLTEALTAYHALQTGVKAAEVTQAAGRVVYTPADANKLQAYIRSLQAAIAINNGGAPSRPYSVATWTR